MAPYAEQSNYTFCRLIVTNGLVFSISGRLIDYMPTGFLFES